jgi:hypothetical protein
MQHVTSFAHGNTPAARPYGDILHCSMWPLECVGAPDAAGTPWVTRNQFEMTPGGDHTSCRSLAPNDAVYQQFQTNALPFAPRLMQSHLSRGFGGAVSTGQAGFLRRTAPNDTASAAMPLIRGLSLITHTA